MFADSNSQYILILKSCFTGDVRAFNVQNISPSTLYLTFRFDWPERFAGSEFDYYVIWCRLPNRITVQPDPLDSWITVTTDDRTDETFQLRNLQFDTGTLKLERQPVGFYSLSIPRPYFSMSREKH